MPHKSPTILAAAALMLVAAPGAHADTTLATEQQPFTVSTYQSAIAWSSFDPEAGAYRLKIREGGAIRTLPVAPRAKPFDVDLGTSRTGRLVAVYSRGGEIFELDPATGAERDLHVHGREPTVLAGRLAYVRRSGGRDVLYLKRSSRAAGRAVFTAGTAKGSGIAQPELSGSRLAFVTSAQPQADRGIRNLRLQTLSGHSKVVYTARSGGANFANIVSPSFDPSGKHLLWARTNTGSGRGNRYIRLTISTGRLAYAIGSAQVRSTGWVEPDRGFASALGPEGNRLVLTGRVAFNAGP